MGNNDDGKTRLGPEARFARRVRSEREARDWSQAQLADQLQKRGLKLHPSAIAKIELQDVERPRAIRLDEASAIAEVFGMGLDELVGQPRALDKAKAVTNLGATCNRAIADLEEILAYFDSAVDALGVGPKELYDALKLAQGGALVSDDEDRLSFKRAALMYEHSGNARNQLRQPVRSLSEVSVFATAPEDYIDHDFQLLSERFTRVLADRESDERQA